MISIEQFTQLLSTNGVVVLDSFCEEYGSAYFTIHGTLYCRNLKSSDIKQSGFTIRQFYEWCCRNYARVVFGLCASRRYV